MLILAELALSSTALLLDPTIRELPETRVRIQFQPAMDPERRRFFVQVTSPDFEQFEAALAADETVEDPELMADGDGVRLYQLGLTDAVVAVTPRVAELGGMVLEMYSRGGVWFVKLQVPDRDALAAFRAFCRENDIEYGLERLYRTDPVDPSASSLTDRHREVLVTAYEAGYFAVPREASQADLAAELGVSDAAVSQRVRRAVAALVESELAPGESTAHHAP